MLSSTAENSISDPQFRGAPAPRGGYPVDMKSPFQPSGHPGPECPLLQRIHPRLQTGRRRILGFLLLQGAAEGLLIAVPVLALISWMALQASPQQLPDPYWGITAVTLCALLGMAQRWFTRGDQWARIWDRCQSNDNLVETLCFLGQQPPLADDWQTALLDQADSVEPPSLKELRRVLTPTGTSPSRGPALTALILIVSWFFFLTSQAPGRLPVEPAEIPLASSSGQTGKTSDTPEQVGKTPSSGDSPSEALSTSEPQSNPSPQSDTDSNAGVSGSGSQLEAVPSDSPTTAIPLEAALAGFASESSQPGDPSEASLRNGLAASGGEDEGSIENTVPAQRSTASLESLTVDSGTGSGVQVPAEESDTLEATLEFPTAGPRTGPANLPPHWQKLVDRYMELRDRTPSGAGRR